MKLNKSFISFLLFGSFFACNNETSSNKEMNRLKKNVLFICIDDLRPELGCYGNDYIKSPNIDKLANSGVVFTNHFVQVPICGASRYSLFTGMLPKTIKHLSNRAFRDFVAGKSEMEEPETFIHHLRRNGYYTVGIGKISHHPDGLLYGQAEQIGTEYELPHSWDEMLLNSGKWGTGWNAFFGYADGENRQSLNSQVKPYEMADVPDTGYPDGLITEQALKKIGELSKKDRPFFLAVGFFKPHLPFTAPKKYWDMYREENIPLSPNPFIPENVNLASLHYSDEFNGYQLGDEEATLDSPVSDSYARKLRHAYFACVSYIDAQVGKLMNELEKQGLSENTIVVLWGDHGWHLGDHLVWGKHTIFERALKSALIIKIPGRTSGNTIDRVISSVDIYPTLMELCGVEMPHETDGNSFTMLLDNQFTTWEDVSYSYFRHGISLRTGKYRLNKYFRNQEPTIELFDHQTDPNEIKNIAADNIEIVERLMPILEKGNTGLYD